MTLALFVIAVVLAVLGLVSLIQGDFLWAIILFVAAAAVGPGGWSVFTRRP